MFIIMIYLYDIQVNTPNRIRAYLGNQFSGCLLIMPSEEIQLVSSDLSMFWA